MQSGWRDLLYCYTAGKAKVRESTAPLQVTTRRWIKILSLSDNRKILEALHSKYGQPAMQDDGKIRTAKTGT